MGLVGQLRAAERPVPRTEEEKHRDAHQGARGRIRRRRCHAAIGILGVDAVSRGGATRGAARRHRRRDAEARCRRAEGTCAGHAPSRQVETVLCWLRGQPPTLQAHGRLLLSHHPNPPIRPTASRPAQSPPEHMDCPRLHPPRSTPLHRRARHSARSYAVRLGGH